MKRSFSFFSALAFCAWWVALKWNSAPWLFVAAVAAGLVTMTKNVFVPFPIILLLGILFLEGHARNAKLTRVALIIAGFFLPFAALKGHNALSRHVNPPEPQSGILFYGRTAQWTKLDGGIEPELKAVIRAEVEDYRARPKLDNNIVIKRTIIPHLWTLLAKQGKTPTDLDHLCRRFAIEAVENEPVAFWHQMRGDLAKLQTRGVEDDFPTADQAAEAIDELRGKDDAQTIHPTMDVDQTIATLQAHLEDTAFQLFHRLLARSLLFQLYPVLETTLGLALLLICTRGREQEFFFGCAAV